MKDSRMSEIIGGEDGDSAGSCNNNDTYHRAGKGGLLGGGLSGYRVLVWHKKNQIALLYKSPDID
jgi:hypothetical protein